MRPSDESARARFAEELERNFSVVASAGSGKTTAITKRILELARSAGAAEALPQLVVVTFTNRAADEMQQRTRQKILDERLPLEVQAAFNRAFFGTIHAFCMKLLTNYGHHLGLPAPLELLGDDDDLWQEFVQQQSQLGRSLGEKNRAALFRLAQARDIMELGRRAGSALLRPCETGPCPTVDFSEVYAAADTGGRDNISTSQAELIEWEKRYAADWEFLRWPNCFTSANAKFTQLWRKSFAPLRKWVSDSALCVAAEVQRDYRDFRLERGVVTYGDQIALADELLQHPVAARRIREENFRVILDEAQDTDPAQFSVLLEIARPPGAEGRWMETHEPPPRAGHFSMVGDFQQSIYRERADLNHYRSVHRALVESGSTEALEFSVTFRLDQRQLDFVNATFREILNDQDGQVAFVELRPRPDVLPGQVVRVSLGADLLPENGKLKDRQKAKIEADELAGWIKENGLVRLRANSWREVAILCPRKLWLRTMSAALRRAGLATAIQSESDLKADSPAHAWLTALCAIMADPLNAYEIVGVLREVFGVSDHDLAIFSDGDGGRFRIDKEEAAVGIVSSQLRTLAQTRMKLAGQSLFDAVTTLIAETQLRQRLASLPPEDYGDLSGELDSLLAAAAEAERNGAILADFAEKLRADFETPRDVRLSSEDAIQLITSYKAKGSEWQAVIVPFLGRNVIPFSPRYPSLLKAPGTGELLVALGKEDQSPEVKEARERAQEQEMERLLYVAATRARHTLVLALDAEIFAKTNGTLQKGSQLKRLLGQKEINTPHFDALGTTADACAVTAQAATLATATAAVSPTKLARLDRRVIARAKERASEFVHKLNPSAYGSDMPNEETSTAPQALTHLRSAADNPATLYGRWWHSFFEKLSWSSGLADAEKLVQERLPHSPDQARSAAEWKLVRKNLFNDPMVTRFTSQSSSRAHAEFPFAWSMNEHAALEGVIDLLLVDASAECCLLLDWKTNRITRAEERSLRARYLPQIAAYWKAVSEITAFDVRAGLFSTALGRVLIYEPAELATEWARLEKLPPDNLRGEVAPEEM